MSRLPSDIENIDKRIAQIKNKKQDKNKYVSGLGFYLRNALRVAVEFVAPVFIGISLGYLLDKSFDTRILFVLILGIFGCAAGVLNVYRAAQEMQKDIDRSV